MEIKVMLGLMWGDEGKGKAVSSLADGPVIRFSGGSQAAHNVIDDGRHHTFSMFGSATFREQETFLSKYVRVDPYNLMWEGFQLMDNHAIRSLDIMFVDKECLITTPYHVAISRYNAPIHNRGTCGLGVGVTGFLAAQHPYFAIRAKDLLDPILLREKLTWLSKDNPSAYENDEFLSSRKGDPVEEIADFFEYFAQSIEIVDGKKHFGDLTKKYESITFEGSQGMLLDPVYGHEAPYVTSTDLTLNPVDEILNGYEYDQTVYGCIRMYSTRHGNGPFPTEYGCIQVPELHNETNKHQGHFRRGWLDLHLIKYVLHSLNNRIDRLFVSHVDCWDYSNQMNEPWMLSHERNKNGVPLYIPYQNLQTYLNAIDSVCRIGFIGTGADAVDCEKY